MAEHHCNCGHEHSAQPKSKYEEALAKYNCNLSDDDVKAAVKKIIPRKCPRMTPWRSRNS